ncbi:MAG: hypothetical protein H8D45_01790 [Bacteroidetes bacterium]|nr:hypothetical protein [Bacteroidota bacterium]
MNSAKIQDKYYLINQLKYCCVPAVLQMIFKRHKINHILDQKSIAYELGLVIPEYLKDEFPEARIGKEPSELGVFPGNKETSLNLLFEKCNLPFREEFIFLNELCPNGINDFLLKNLTSDIDIIAGVSYGVLTNDTGKIETMHVVLIEYLWNDKVQLVVPHEEKSYRLIVSLKALINSIKYAKDGFWRIIRVRNE